MVAAPVLLPQFTAQPAQLQDAHHAEPITLISNGVTQVPVPHPERSEGVLAQAAPTASTALGPGAVTVALPGPIGITSEVCTVCVSYSCPAHCL